MLSERATNMERRFFPSPVLDCNQSLFLLDILRQHYSICNTKWRRRGTKIDSVKIPRPEPEGSKPKPLPTLPMGPNQFWENQEDEMVPKNNNVNVGAKEIVTEHHINNFSSNVWYSGNMKFYSRRNGHLFDMLF